MKYAILLVILLPLLAAGGQPAASEEPVFTLNDLLSEALRRSPDVLVAQKRY